MAFQKWTSIGKFSDVYKNAQRNSVGKVTYRSKIKLHGTNAAIRFEGMDVIAQKRTSDITVGADNAGFAAFVESLILFPIHLNRLNGLIVYGEWAGPGIQKSDAVALIPEKMFFIFAVYDTALDKWCIEPTEIANILSLLISAKSQRIHILPWATETRTIDFLDQQMCQDFITSAVKVVDREIGECDPYIKSMFGVEGTGEGLVFYPTGEYADLGGPFMFKVKSDAHTVQKGKKKDRVAPPKPEGIDEFVTEYFTDNRMQQMLDEHFDGVADRKDTGAFLKTIMSDVHKESVNEIELADFEWGQVSKYAVNVVKKWFFDKADELQ